MGPITWSQRVADVLTELLEAGVANLAAAGTIDPDATNAASSTLTRRRPRLVTLPTPSSGVTRGYFGGIE